MNDILKYDFRFLNLKNSYFARKNTFSTFCGAFSSENILSTVFTKHFRSKMYFLQFLRSIFDRKYIFSTFGGTFSIENDIPQHCNTINFFNQLIFVI
jgi:hypothetical protein